MYKCQPCCAPVKSDWPFLTSRGYVQSTIQAGGTHMEMVFSATDLHNVLVGCSTESSQKMISKLISGYINTLAANTAKCKEALLSRHPEVLTSCHGSGCDQRSITRHGMLFIFQQLLKGRGEAIVLSFTHFSI